jgi:hypothetical protein
MKDRFVAEMEKRWLSYPMSRNGRPRICTPALRKLWAQFYEVFANRVGATSGPAPVIAAPLGAGKTTAAKVFASMLDYTTHPGVMIVVRTIAAAEQMAADINAWAGRDDTALAYHSEVPDAVKHDLAGMAKYPVLVVCHQNYTMAVDPHEAYDTTAKFEAMHKFRDGRRQLVVVDESLDLIFEATVTPTTISYAKSRVPTRIKRHHRAAMRLFNSVEDALLAVAETPGRRPLPVEALLKTAGMTAEEADATLLGLCEALAKAKMDRRVRRKIVDVVIAVRRQLAVPRWGASDDHTEQIVASHLVLPPDVAMVVLDATAEFHAVYTRSEFYAVVPDLEPVRSYEPATQYVIRARGTGIKAMDEDGARVAGDTLRRVLDHYDERAHERHVLVVTNKGSEEKVRAIWESAPFASVTVEHWWDLDGRNDLSHCNTIVTLTLPYATAAHDLAVYLALAGQPLGDDGDEPEDVREIRESRIAGELAQASGRTCIRDLTTESGACEPADMFTRLPHWDRVVHTDAILAHLRRALPGVKQVELDREHMVDWAKAYGVLFMAPGPLVRPEADISKRTWMRLLKDAQTPGGQLYNVMATAGVELVKQGNVLYVRKVGDADVLPASERVVVALAEGLHPGESAALTNTGLTERARLRAVRRPAVKARLAELGVRVERRAARAGGLTLTRQASQPP